MPSLPMTPATPAYLLRSADDRLRFPRCRAVAANGKGQEGAGGGGGGGRDAGDGNVVCPLHKASATSRDSVRFFNYLLFFFFHCIMRGDLISLSASEIPPAWMSS